MDCSCGASNPRTSLFCKGCGRPLARFGALAKVLAWLVFAFLIAVGFDFRTPRSQFAELRAQDIALARTLTSVMDSIRAQRASTLQLLRALAVRACLDSSPRDANLMQLPCDSLTGQRRRE